MSSDLQKLRITQQVHSAVTVNKLNQEGCEISGFSYNKICNCGNEQDVSQIWHFCYIKIATTHTSHISHVPCIRVNNVCTNIQVTTEEIHQAPNLIVLSLTHLVMLSVCMHNSFASCISPELKN